MDYPQQHIKPYNEDGKKTEQVERMFDNIAHAYDKLNHTLSLGIDRSWRRKAIAWLRPFRPQHIMDVATGTGDFAILACRELNPDELIGTDISEGMMNVGREKVKKEGLSDKISFAREDCTSLSFADNRFDAITVAFGIRNFEDLDKGLSEMCRVLKPGGHLVILELTTPLPHEATVRHLLESSYPIAWQTPLQRQQCLPLSAGHYQSISPRGSHERSHIESRIRRSSFPTVDIWYLHTLYSDKIMKNDE